MAEEQDYRAWGLEREGRFSVVDFVNKFKYYERTTAHRSYKGLINDVIFTKSTRGRLKIAFDIWKANKADSFWASRHNDRKYHGAVLAVEEDVIEDAQSSAQDRAKKRRKEIASSNRSPPLPGSPCSSVDSTVTESSPLFQFLKTTPSRLSRESMPPAQRVPAHPPFQYDADNESFVFVAQTGKMAIGDSFTNYHQACKGLNFNRKRCADYLATTGVLLMTPQPTELQKRFFPDYEDLLNLTEGWLTSPSNDDIEDITSRYRSAKDAYRRQNDTLASRAAFRTALEGKKHDAFQRLALHACNNLPSNPHGTYTEASSTSALVLPQLQSILTQPDRSCLHYTATNSTSSTNFIRRLQGLTPTQNAKHPDLILRAGSNDLEMGFGEVSGKGVNDVEKDVGDFARLCIWAKKALDTAWIQYEGLDDWQIPFFQVLGSELYMYWMRRVGSVCVAWQASCIPVVDSLRVMCRFEDELEEWKSLEDNFLDSLEQLEVAQFSPRQSPAGKVFIGITTPSARVMPTGPRTRRNTSRQ